MNAWLCESLEGISHMRFHELPVPLPQADEVRIAGRTIGERINAQGDAAYASESDATAAMSTAERIEQVEGHYADACAAFRG